MAATTIAGLFIDQRRGEATLTELKAAGFSSAQISEVADADDAPAPKKLNDPLTDFFHDHTATGSEFRSNLVSLGMADADAQYFEDGVARGGALVTVKADARAAEAVEIMRRNGADLGSQARSMPPPAAATTTGASTNSNEGAGASAPANLNAGDQVLQLRAERLAIDKVRVASGEARVRKEVITEQQSIDVPVTHEELVIERHPVSGDAPAGGPIGATETVTVPLSREEINVGKQTVVTEEVEIGKRAVAETAHVSETTRREELVINDVDNVKTPQRTT